MTVLFKQKSDTVPGEFLGRLVLGVEDDKVKVFGATILISILEVVLVGKVFMDNRKNYSCVILF